MVRNRLLMAMLAAVVLAGPVAAEDKKKAAEAPDEKAIMEAMMKAATPGEMHKKLEPLVGKWDVSTKMWMDPTKSPSESKATVETKWVMDGRYIQTIVAGDIGGMKFMGQGLSGYDNLRKTFVSSWIDNFGTGIGSSFGKVDKDGTVFTFEGEELDPITKQKFKSRDVIRIIDANSYEETFYKLVGDKEIKVMEMTATRKK